MQQVVDQTKERSLMGRYGTIDEQVNAILFLASEESSYMTGSVIAVGGGDQVNSDLNSRKSCKEAL
jgi:dihydroxycyclohexadiene carboxylate dehydrogenase